MACFIFSSNGKCEKLQGKDDVCDQYRICDASLGLQCISGKCYCPIGWYNSKVISAFTNQHLKIYILGNCKIWITVLTVNIIFWYF